MQPVEGKRCGCLIFQCYQKVLKPELLELESYLGASPLREEQELAAVGIVE